MATHDYNIANQSASAFRGDLNNVLQAILTQNSSATAPTTTAADMLWYDTANNQIKKRNEANSAWIILGTVDETVGTFTASGGPPTQGQAVWNTGTSTVESTITPTKLDSKIANRLNASGTAPMYACRAWVNFNGTGIVAIRGSGNVTSITDNGTGDYTINFTVAMPNANYAVVGTAAYNQTSTIANLINPSPTVLATSSVRLVCGYQSDTSDPGAFADPTLVSISVFC